MNEWLTSTLLPMVLSNMLIATGIAVLALLAQRLRHGANLAHCLWVLCLLKLVTPPIWQVDVPFRPQVLLQPLLGDAAIAPNSATDPSIPDSLAASADTESGPPARWRCIDSVRPSRSIRPSTTKSSPRNTAAEE